MKHWYVIVGGTYQQCEFINVRLMLGYLYLRYFGIKVKFLITAMEYNEAKTGHETTVTAVSKKESKKVKIVFK